MAGEMCGAYTRSQEQGVRKEPECSEPLLLTSLPLELNRSVMQSYPCTSYSDSVLYSLEKAPNFFDLIWELLNTSIFKYIITY